jgi:hypothetical protein
MVVHRGTRPLIANQRLVFIGAVRLRRQAVYPTRQTQPECARRGAVEDTLAHGRPSMLAAQYSTRHRVPSTAPTHPKDAVAAHALAARARFAKLYEAPAHRNGAPDMPTGAA